MTTAQPETPAWLASAAAWLTPRRLRAQAVVLALCLWGVCAVDFATPGVFDRVGNIKFQDFLPLYISAQLIAQHRTSELYDQQVGADQMQTIVYPTNVGQPTRVRLPNLYGPQVGLLFVPLARLSFQTAAWIWVAVCMSAFFGCTFVVWKCCPALSPHSGIVAVSALAFPPLFHFFVRGQISVLPLACFTAAFLAFRAQHDWLAGMALGLLVFKPQFLVAIPLVLLLSGAWRVLGGLTLSAAAEVAFTNIYFGAAVMRSYFDMLWHTSRWIGAAELGFAPIQMHSLRSFWSLLIPWPRAAFALYALSSVVTIGMAAAAWKSSRPLAVRFSALTLAAVLVNPHLFVYDLLVLVPVLMLLADWTLSHAQHLSSDVLRLLLYLAFMTPLLGPLSRWTHFQLSVPVFAAMLWALWRTHVHETPGHKLASNDCSVV